MFLNGFNPMAITPANDLSNSDRIRLEQLLGLVTRCILFTLVFVVSTGPLIRQLIGIVLRDLMVLLVGSFWLLGDIIPCLALLLLIHDTLIARKQDKFLDAIVTLFTILYLIDFIIFTSCYFQFQLNNSNNCNRFLANYRYALFHIQIFFSILYLKKPWQWTKFDLRKILAYLERFYLLAYNMTQAILRRIDHSSRQAIEFPRHPPYQSSISEDSLSARFVAFADVSSGPADMPSDRPVNHGGSKKATGSSATNLMRPHKRPQEPPSDNSITPANQLSSPQLRTSTRRRRKLTSTGLKHVKVVIKRPLTATSVKRRQRIGSTRRSHVRQTVRMRGSRHSCYCCCGKKLKGHRCTGGNESSRTVNLNLNMN